MAVKRKRRELPPLVRIERDRKHKNRLNVWYATPELALAMDFLAQEFRRQQKRRRARR